jgi:hypothetical protein
MLTSMDLTIRRAIFASISLLVTASLVLDALIFGAAGRALDFDLFLEIEKLFPRGFEFYPNG